MSEPADLTIAILREIQADLREIKQRLASLEQRMSTLEQRVEALDRKLESFRDDLDVTTGIAIKFSGERLIWKRLEKRIEKLEQQP